MKMKIMAVMVAIVLSAAGLAHGELRETKFGTIVDTAQNLVWLKNANCFGKVSWYTANAVSVPSLSSGQCGLRDDSVAGEWRLPTRTELQARLSDRAGFTNVQGDVYWTYQSGEYSAYTAWFVNIGNGVVNYWGKGEMGYVWPVRAKK